MLRDHRILRSGFVALSINTEKWQLCCRRHRCQPVRCSSSYFRGFGASVPEPDPYKLQMGGCTASSVVASLCAGRLLQQSQLSGYRAIWGQDPCNKGCHNAGGAWPACALAAKRN